MRPEKIVHIGLGAFFRAHQAWYTAGATDSEDWGIVAYSGRSAELPQKLTSQDNKYTLITRSDFGDTFQRVSSIVRSVAGSDTEDLIKTLSNKETTIVSLTITEAGYQVDENQPLADSALGRLTLALNQRRIANSEPIALVSCDNIPNNADSLKSAMVKLGSKISDEYLQYLQTLSFVSTSIDRITPATTQADIDLVREKTGFEDLAPVVTEPFSSWVISGEFPMGRPRWETAGAKFVEDIEPFENRKLWLLNGAHTLMSSFGILRGHQRVDQAIEDREVLAEIHDWFTAASKHLPEGMDLPNYQQSLVERFQNRRIAYQLAQISSENLTKLSVRIAPVAEKELAEGIICAPAVIAIASYIALIQSGGEITDARISEIQKALDSNDPVREITTLISPTLANSEEFVKSVAVQQQKFLEQAKESNNQRRNNAKTSVK